MVGPENKAEPENMVGPENKVRPDNKVGPAHNFKIPESSTLCGSIRVVLVKLPMQHGLPEGPPACMYVIGD